MLHGGNGWMHIGAFVFEAELPLIAVDVWLRNEVIEAQTGLASRQTHCKRDRWFLRREWTREPYLDVTLLLGSRVHWRLRLFGHFERFNNRQQNTCKTTREP